MSEIRHDDRVVIVTGAGNGLGRSHALELARRGAKVVVADLGCDAAGKGADPAVSRATVREITDAGGEAIASANDLRDPEAGQAVVAAAREAFGRIDAIVCSAGIVSFPGDVADTPYEDIANHLSTDPHGSLNVIRAAWPFLQSGGGGRIVLTVSSAVFGVGTALGYASAKGGTLGVGKGLARAGEGHNIKTNIIAPYGFTREMTTFERPPAAVAAKERTLPPARVSALVAYLAHEDCPVSGEFFGVGGGRVVRIVYMENEGYTDVDLSAEDVRDNWDQIYELNDLTRVISNKQFVDRFYDHIPGFREAEAEAEKVIAAGS